MISETRRFWDEQASTFDEEADHGLRDDDVRKAWTALLLPLLPSAPASVVDLGCGTGTLSVLLATAGHVVRGLDLSPRMIDEAQEKALQAGVTVAFVEGDAADPPYEPASADVVLGRHVLWAFSDLDSVVSRWVRLLKPNGRLVLVEGRWSTGAGLSAGECEALVRRHRDEAVVQPLTDSALWGKPIQDERYLLFSRR